MAAVLGSLKKQLDPNVYATTFECDLGVTGINSIVCTSFLIQKPGQWFISLRTVLKIK